MRFSMKLNPEMSGDIGRAFKGGRQPDEARRAWKRRLLLQLATIAGLGGVAAGGAWLIVSEDSLEGPPTLRPAFAVAQPAPTPLDLGSARISAVAANSVDDAPDLRTLVKPAAILTSYPASERPAPETQPQDSKIATPVATQDTSAAAAALRPAPESLPSEVLRTAFQNAIPKVSPAAAKEIAPLIERSRALIAQGNIAGARLVLERAISAGSGEALLRLGKTYDSAILSQWRAFGVQPDLAKARDLYRQAAELGVTDGQERTAALAPIPPRQK